MPASSNESDRARLVFLGTAGGPSVVRGCRGIATALVLGDEICLVDAGYGCLGQFVDAGLSLGQLRTVLITHLHGDHLADLFNLFMFGSTTALGRGDGISSRVEVIGPGEVHEPHQLGEPYGSAPYPGVAGFLEHSYMGQRLTLNAWAMAKPDLREIISLHEIQFGDGPVPDEPFLVHETETIKVTATLVPHLARSYAFRIDSEFGSVVFSGDTGPSKSVSRLATGADVLVHELLDIEAAVAAGLPAHLAGRFCEVHTDVSDVGMVAEESGVPCLVVNHFVPPALWSKSPEELRARIAEDFGGRIVVAHDMMSLPISAGGSLT